ncbi:DedA family protein [Rubrobacter radiotolerans]|nr:DedA family protein [Rubrobacter radiotolerans]
MRNGSGMSDWVIETMRTLGYLGLALLLLVENVFPPIPSEVVLPLAGFLVGLGELNFWGAVAFSTLGAVAGAWVLYGLGRWGGRTVILRYGRFLRVSAKELDQAESWFRRYGDWIVLFARVVPLARSIVSIPAGTMRMPPLRFTLLTTAGTLTWNTTLIYAGTVLGANWSAVSEFIGTYSTYVYIALAVLVALYITLKVVAHFRD